MRGPAALVALSLAAAPALAGGLTGESAVACSGADPALSCPSAAGTGPIPPVLGRGVVAEGRACQVIAPLADNIFIGGSGYRLGHQVQSTGRCR